MSMNPLRVFSAKPTLREALSLDPTDELPPSCALATHRVSRREVLAFGTCYLCPEEYLEGYNGGRHVKWRVVGLIPGGKNYIVCYYCTPISEWSVAIGHLYAMQKRVVERVRLLSRRKRQQKALKFVRQRVPATIPGENNDCGVVTLANLFGVAYEVAHRWCEKRGRKKGQGTQLWGMLSKAPGGYVVINPDRPAHALRFKAVIAPWFAPCGGGLSHGGEAKGRGTLLSFVRNHPTGKFLVVSSGHAYCVIEGCVVDGNAYPVSPLSRITYAFEAR